MADSVAAPASQGPGKVATTFQIIGMGLQVYGGLMQAAYQRKAAKAEARLAEKQAEIQNIMKRIEEQKAREATRSGAVMARKLSLRAEAYASRQKASFGASGVRADVGSAADIQADSIAAGAADVKTTQRNAALEAWGHMQQAIVHQEQSSMLNEKAYNTRKLGSMQATLTYLDTASQVSSSLASYFAQRQ